jgi:hypothetical protein
VARRHPLRRGPLIDWDLILVMEPSTILGALLGGYLNKVRTRAGGCVRVVYVCVCVEGKGGGGAGGAQGVPDQAAFTLVLVCVCMCVGWGCGVVGDA